MKTKESSILDKMSCKRALLGCVVVGEAGFGADELYCH